MLRAGALNGLRRFDVRVQCVTQGFAIDWLAQERGEQILLGGRGLVLQVPGYHDDRDLLVRADARADRFRNVVSIDVRHIDIEENGRVRLVVYLHQPRMATGSVIAAIAAGLDQIAQGVQDRDIVVDEQYAVVLLGCFR